MQNAKLNINSGPLFPWYFQLLGAIFLVVGIVVILENFIISIVLLLLGLGILTGYSGIQIDSIKKTYRPYNSFYLLKFGDTLSFNSVEKIFINSNKIMQRIYTTHTLQSSTFEKRQFDAYMKFDSGKKEYLLSNKSKNKLMARLQHVAMVLNVQITDNSKVS